jgi:hypothetical protein
MDRSHRSARSIASLSLLLLLAPPLDGQQVVAPLSTQLPHGAPDSAVNASRFDKLISTALTGGGFTVLPTAASDSAWQGAIATFGGPYDPYTGHLIPERLRAMRTATLATSRAQAGATLLLSSRVIEIAVPNTGDTLSWDGVFERIGGGAPASAGLGEIPALSLVLVASDSAGQPVRCGRGGIQLLVKGSFFHAARPIDSAKILTDRKRVSTAVAVAVSGLVGSGSSCQGIP